MGLLDKLFGGSTNNEEEQTMEQLKIGIILAKVFARSRKSTSRRMGKIYRR